MAKAKKNDGPVMVADSTKTAAQFLIDRCKDFLLGASDERTVDEAVKHWSGLRAKQIRDSAGKF